jgi:hypothetical protein
MLIHSNAKFFHSHPQNLARLAEEAFNAQRPTSIEHGEHRPDIRESIAALWAVSCEIRCILRANSACGSQFGEASMVRFDEGRLATVPRAE